MIVFLAPEMILSSTELFTSGPVTAKGFLYDVSMGSIPPMGFFSGGAISTIWLKDSIFSESASLMLLILALDKDNLVVSTSKVAHVASKGGKVGNYKSVSIKKAVLTKAKKLKAGKNLKLSAKANRASSLKVKSHRTLRYESTDTKQEIHKYHLLFYQ